AFNVRERAADAGGLLGLQVDGDRGGVSGVVQRVVAGGAVELAGDRLAGGEGEGVVAGAAGQVLDVLEEHATHVAGILAGYVPAIGQIGRDQLVAGRLACHDGLDVLEAAGGGCEPALEVHGHGGRELRIVQDVAAAAAIDSAGDVLAGAEGEG